MDKDGGTIEKKVRKIMYTILHYNTKINNNYKIFFEILSKDNIACA